MSEEIHNLLKIQNDNITFFTVIELKMIDDYINELEAYKYNMDRDYLRLEKENQELKKQLEEKNKPQIFIDTQDIEERYGEGLYQNYLEEENKKLNEELDKLNHIIDKQDKDIVILSKGNKELKKQLEEANEKILLLQASDPMLEYKKTLEENQQKDFIEWLTNEANINPYDISDYIYENIINTILSKYEEIIEK